LYIGGNEHECKTSLAESLVGTFRIYQPGSSVATSLVEGESLSNPKHMGFIEIKTRKFRHSVVPYTQVRSFMYGEINLTEPQYNLDVNHPKLEEQIKHCLAAKMRAMVAAGRAHAGEVTPYFMQDGARLTDAATGPGADADAEEPHAFTDEEIAAAAKARGITHVTRQRNIVLARLRIEQPTGFPTVHPQRFGAQFVGEVANPGELLLFAKNRKERVSGAAGVSSSSSGSAAAVDDGTCQSVRVEDLVRRSLQSSKSLSLLPESELAQALEDFVLKRHISAITDVVAETLERVQGELQKDAGEMNTKALIVDGAKRLKETAEEEIRRNDLTRVRTNKRRPVVEDDEQPPDAGDSDASSVPAAKGRAGAGGRGTKGGRGPAAVAAAGRGRGGRAAAAASEATKSNAAALSESEEEEEEVNPTKTSRARRAAAPPTKVRLGHC
jgi:double-strand break repair protein MRE11